MSLSESFVQSPLKIQGYLIGARVSRNRNIYLPEILERLPEYIVNAPIYWEHVAADRSVGRVVGAKYDPLQMDVFYEAEIYDEEAIDRIRAGLLSHVSLAGDYEVFETPLGYDLIAKVTDPSRFEVSLVAVPGIPQSSIAIAEKFGSKRIVENSKILLAQTEPSRDDSGVGSQDGSKRRENMSKEKEEKVEEKSAPTDQINKTLEEFKMQLQTYQNGMQMLQQQNSKIAESLSWLKAEKPERARVSNIDDEPGKKESANVQEAKRREKIWTL